VPGVHAGFAHPRAADAGELRVRKTPAQRRYQPCAEKVARSLARDQRDAHG
jgi:hypothetical protein